MCTPTGVHLSYGAATVQSADGFCSLEVGRTLLRSFGYPYASVVRQATITPSSPVDPSRRSREAVVTAEHLYSAERADELS